MKARYKYRCYPNLIQQIQLAKLFGCCGLVWNHALAHCIQEFKANQKKPSNAELQKVFITLAKKTINRAWLPEVSNIPLQQSLQQFSVGRPQ